MQLIIYIRCASCKKNVNNENFVSKQKNRKKCPRTNSIFAINTTQRSKPKIAKEQFFANACRIMLISSWNNISQKEIFNKTFLFLQRSNSKQMNRIKEVLEEKGIKQTWLAEKLGKSYNMVNSYAQNRKQPRLEVLYDIAKILDVSVKDLLIDNEISKDIK